MNIFGLHVFEVDLGDALAPDLPDALEYLEPGDLIRFHTTTKRSIETAPGCYVVRFFQATYAGRVVSVDDEAIVIRYYMPEQLIWRRAETSVEHIELILKASAD